MIKDLSVFLSCPYLLLYYQPTAATEGKHVLDIRFLPLHKCLFTEEFICQTLEATCETKVNQQGNERRQQAHFLHLKWSQWVSEWVKTLLTNIQSCFLFFWISTHKHKIQLCCVTVESYPNSSSDSNARGKKKKKKKSTMTDVVECTYYTVMINWWSAGPLWPSAVFQNKLILIIFFISFINDPISCWIRYVLLQTVINEARWLNSSCSLPWKAVAHSLWTHWTSQRPETSEKTETQMYSTALRDRSIKIKKYFPSTCWTTYIVCKYSNTKNTATVGQEVKKKIIGLTYGMKLMLLSWP